MSDYGQIIRDAVRHRNTSLRAVSEILSINYTTARYFINGDNLEDPAVLNAGETLLTWSKSPASSPTSAAQGKGETGRSGVHSEKPNGYRGCSLCI